MAVTNLEAFTVRIRQSKREAREKHQERTKAAALYALQNLIFGTRVDKGRARGNWQVTEGTPAEGFDPERYDLSGSLGNRDAFAEEAANVLGASGSDIIWIHNGVPYIQVLEGLDQMLAGALEATRTWLASQATKGAGGAGVP